MAADADHGTIAAVEGFWQDNVCGEHFIDAEAERQTAEFFAAYRKFRYDKEHHLNSLIDWTGATGKDVLEIGLGLGADSTRWAAHARSFTGIDLTRAAVEATGRHLKGLGLKGKIVQGNAEALPFADDSFDQVYSHGVLHHTPDTLASLKEVHRVLRPGGTLIVMFYSRDSFNYWVRIQVLMRLRLLANLLGRRLGRSAAYPWAQHMKNLDERGWRYFSWKTWPHHCTDGPECEIAYIRSGAQIRQLLQSAGFTVDKEKKAHFPIGAGQGIERFLSRYLGFYQFVWSTK